MTPTDRLPTSSPRTADALPVHDWLCNLLAWAQLPIVQRAHCPGSTEAGCRCVEHAPGPFAQPASVRLNVVTLGKPEGVLCTGNDYTCRCERHAGEREDAIARQRAARTRQPWEPKRRAA